MSNGNQVSGATILPNKEDGVGVPDINILEQQADQQVVSHSAWSPRKGDQVPHATRGWTLNNQLGAGGAGEVWLGHNGSTSHAFKFFTNANSAKLFQLEEANLSNIKNKLRDLPSSASEHIVMLHDLQFVNSPYWLSFDYIEGGTLESLMLKGPMPWREAWEILQPILECMAVVHEQGIVHRDLKPANILLTNKTKPYKPRITDFGIGKMLVDDIAAKQRKLNGYTTTVGIGTLGYMSVEQSEGIKPDPSDDVYSLAVILWQMLVGPTSDKVLRKLHFIDYINELRAPAKVKKVIRDCVFLPRAKRPPDARALLNRLKPKRHGKMWLYTAMLMATGSMASSLWWNDFLLLDKISLPTIASISWLNKYLVNVEESLQPQPLPTPPNHVYDKLVLVMPEPEPKQEPKPKLQQTPVLKSNLTPDAGTTDGRFVKISADGSKLPATANTWACVHDTTTGLTWEVKTDDDSPRSHKRTYVWSDPNTPTNSSSICTNKADCDTVAYVRTVNNQNLCGISDWRIPELEELRSIVDYGRSDPAIDKYWFPHTPSGVFWSVSASVKLSVEPWYVNFFNGSDDYIALNSPQYLRLVRKDN